MTIPFHGWLHGKNEKMKLTHKIFAELTGFPAQLRVIV